MGGEFTRREFLQKAGMFGISTLGLGLGLGLGTGNLFVEAVQAETLLGTCGPPPPAHAQRVRAAEGVPPLPGPVVPLRRTEQFRPPNPPVLIAKLMYGNGQDWTTDPGDLARLMAWACPRLGIRYSDSILDFNSFAQSERLLDPDALPILYITGHEAFQFTEDQRTILREYLQAGGFLFGDACCGRRAFADSFRKEMRKIFPELGLRRLPPDHPIHSLYQDSRRVSVYRDLRLGEEEADLEGIDIGCRTPGILTPRDYSCGWAGHRHATGLRVKPEEAPDLGVNLIAYSMSTHTYGVNLRKSPIFTSPIKQFRGKFSVAQVRYGDGWNPDPSAVGKLLRKVQNNSNVQVLLDRKEVKLTDADLFSFPFLYVTGHYDFRLTDQEVRILRNYLSNGGFLLADACCGRTSFDTAFRRELKRALPDASLEGIPAGDPLYTSFNRITAVSFTSAVVEHPSMAKLLEGVRIQGNWSVVYSRLDLGCGLEGEPCPLCQGVSPDDSLRLATNIIMYVLTH